MSFARPRAQAPEVRSYGCLRCAVTWWGEPVCWSCGNDGRREDGSVGGLIVSAITVERQTIGRVHPEPQAITRMWQPNTRR